MSAIVTAKFLGDSVTEQELRARVRQRFAKNPADVRIGILGSERVDDIEIKVTAIDGRRSVRWLHSKGREHDIPAIMASLDDIAVELSLNL